MCFEYSYDGVCTASGIYCEEKESITMIFEGLDKRFTFWVRVSANRPGTHLHPTFFLAAGSDKLVKIDREKSYSYPPITQDHLAIGTTGSAEILISHDERMIVMSNLAQQGRPERLVDDF
jgi:hypothetical protein